MSNNECTKCIHKAVCKTAQSCDGYVSGCEHFKGGWISVKDRLPETKTEVLVYTGTNILSHTFFATEYIIQSGITHWMPLPQLRRKDGW